eukprot:1028865-Prorocentrum_minimum.AAC.1
MAPPKNRVQKLLPRHYPIAPPPDPLRTPFKRTFPVAVAPPKNRLWNFWMTVRLRPSSHMQSAPGSEADAKGEWERPTPVSDRPAPLGEFPAPLGEFHTPLGEFPTPLGELSGYCGRIDSLVHEGGVEHEVRGLHELVAEAAEGAHQARGRLHRRHV